MLMTLGIISLAGCESPVSDSALCTGLRPHLMALTDVVLKEGTDNIVVQTNVIVVKFEAGCNP